jgi:zinc/manganese transport system ATP-binding protein
VGYVPQRRNIDPDLPVRGRDFVHLGIDGNRWGVALGNGAADRQRVDDAIAAVDSAAYADRPIGRLSGGEQQRLLLAQALAGRPRMLLLDEPLASLDLRNQIVISQLVADLARKNGLTVLLIAHDVNPLLPIVDRVLYVAHGGVAIGKPDEVITAEQLSRLYNAPVEVLHDAHGHLFVVGLEAESGHHDG